MTATYAFRGSPGGLGSEHLPVEIDLEAEGRSSSSLSRMLNVLDLFTVQHPSLTVDEIAVRVGVPKSTGYRYVQELCKVGLLVRLDRSITLGPRIIELDRSIRECDPVIRAAASPMRSLTEHTGLDTSLSKLYGSSIISVYMEHGQGAHVSYGYGRGKPLPLWRGSSSKALVSAMPAAKLRRLHGELMRSPVGIPEWSVFYEEVGKIRRQGYCITSDELNEGTTGISAPIFGRGRSVVASITINGRNDRLALFNISSVADLVIRTGDAISLRLSADQHL